MRQRWIAALALMVASCGGPVASGTDGGADARPDGHSELLCSQDSDCGGAFCAIRRCIPGAPLADERGCVDMGSPCSPTESCDEDADRCLACDSEEADRDGDGYDAIACGGDDCDDDDGSRHPGNPEVCDAVGHDDDCNPLTLGPDGDGDGVPSSACCNIQLSGSLLCGADCDDTSMEVNPATIEVCNGRDDDCDGVLDGPGEDTDRDGWPAECAGLGASETDCDDAVATSYPGAPELCNRIDNDCSLAGAGAGGTDTSEDEDGDGHSPSLATCEGGFAKDDCDDADPTRYGTAPELCDGRDNDCDAMVDESCGACAGEPGGVTVSQLESVVDACRHCGFDAACHATCAADALGLSSGCEACLAEFTQCAPPVLDGPECSSPTDIESHACRNRICEGGFPDPCARILARDCGVPLRCPSCVELPFEPERHDSQLYGLQAWLRCQNGTEASCTDAACVKSCMHLSLSARADCQGCWDGFEDCRRANCAVACASPASPGCLACLDGACGTELDGCIGADTYLAECDDAERAEIEAHAGTYDACLYASDPSACASSVDAATGAVDVSPACEGCHALAATCFLERCETSGECEPGDLDDPSCLSCGCANCGDAFQACAGRSLSVCSGFVPPPP